MRLAHKHRLALWLAWPQISLAIGFGASQGQTSSLRDIDALSDDVFRCSQLPDVVDTSKGLDKYLVWASLKELCAPTNKQSISLKQDGKRARRRRRHRRRRAIRRALTRTDPTLPLYGTPDAPKEQPLLVGGRVRSRSRGRGSTATGEDSQAWPQRNSRSLRPRAAACAPSGREMKRTRHSRGRKG